jgi:hypothetical protein
MIIGKARPQETIMPSAPGFTVSELDDRIVPSATLLDLTTVGAEAMAGEAIVRQVDAQPTGTGYIQSFVRLQGAASGGGGQQGYNTSARPLQFDENSSPVFTRNLQLSAVPVVMVNGVAYREFLLDINQKSSSPKLSLDEVRIFTSGTAGLTGYNPTEKTLGGETAKFDLDSATDYTVILNARLNSGSGSGDMVLLVPSANFAGVDPTSYVYLYSKMGGVAGATANGGFEEWAVRKPGGVSGTTGTSSLGGMVYYDADQDGFFNPDNGDLALAGVTVTLQGIDDLGQNVVLTTVTAADGTYRFTNLRAGTYTITETQPPQYIDGEDFVGTINGLNVGESVGDRFTDIILGHDEHGYYYDFTEYLFDT